MKLQISLQKTLKKYLESNSTYYKTPIGIAKITGDNNGIQAITFITNNLNEVNPKSIGMSAVSYTHLTLPTNREV